MAVKLICNEEEPIENTLRRFKRSINAQGNLKTARHKEMWETAADKKKRKAESAKFLNRFLD
jgi:ribosomal protein S21